MAGQDQPADDGWVAVRNGVLRLARPIIVRVRQPIGVPPYRVAMLDTLQLENNDLMVDGLVTRRVW